MPDKSIHEKYRLSGIIDKQFFQIVPALRYLLYVVYKKMGIFACNFNIWTINHALATAIHLSLID